MYENSFIGKYYNYEIRSDHGVVGFYDTTTKEFVGDEDRFKILLNIPDESKLYFQPISWWQSKYLTMPVWINTKSLSFKSHGFQTNNAPGTKSLFYKPPFYLVFKTSSGTHPNLLIFNNVLKSNSEDCILALLNYDDDRNLFYAEYSPGITLPYSNYLSLNNILEFSLFDSKKNLVTVSDLSQLFILLIIL